MPGQHRGQAGLIRLLQDVAGQCGLQILRAGFTAQCCVIGGEAPVKSLSQLLHLLGNRHIANTDLAQRGIKIGEKAINQLLRQGICGRRQLLQPPEREAHVQRQRLETAHHGIGNARRPVERGRPGGRHNVGVNPLHRRGLFLLAEQRENHGQGGTLPDQGSRRWLREVRTRVTNRPKRASYRRFEAGQIGLRHMTRRFFGLRGTVVLAAVLSLGLAACEGEVLNRGWQADDRALDQIKPGASAEQVLLVLGTPSTVSTVGGKTYYYVSQRLTRRFQFLDERIQDQRVVAVYLDAKNKVARVANFGIQDGQIFDFVSRTTPTGGDEQTVLRQLFRAANLFSPPAL
jgi:outer membrane protein assembly factor BamE (lipoprotein component of BamABCDE complex)